MRSVRFFLLLSLPLTLLVVSCKTKVPSGVQVREIPRVREIPDAFLCHKGGLFSRWPTKIESKGKVVEARSSNPLGFFSSSRHPKAPFSAPVSVFGSIGEVGKARYYDPQGLFSVRVPLGRLPSGVLVRDEIQPNRRAVWFFERAGCGDFFRIDILASPLPIFFKKGEMSSLKSSFSRTREFVKKEYQSEAHRSYLFHQEYLKEKKFDLDFFVFDFPSSSTIKSPKTGKNLDGIRGVASFFHNKSLFIVSYQKHFPPFEEFITDKNELQRLDRTNNGRVQWVKRALLAVIDTMRFKFGNIKQTPPGTTHDPLGPAIHSEPDWRELPYLSPD